MSKKNFQLFLVAISCIFCASSFATSTVVKKIGRFEIKDKDIKYRNAVARIYNSSETRDIGLILLEQDFKLAQVLENNEGRVKKETLLLEEDRINKETQVPEKLERIKAVFGSDHDAYLQDFVMPTYVRRHLYYEFFLKNPKVQKNSLAKANLLAQELQKSGSRFCASGEKKKYSCVKFTVSETEGFGVEPPPGLSASHQKPPPSESEKKEAQAFIRELIKPLKPGGVSKVVSSFGEHWRVVRFVRNEKDKYFLEGIYVPKDSYQDWLTHEIAKVKVSKSLNPK